MLMRRWCSRSCPRVAHHVKRIKPNEGVSSQNRAWLMRHRTEADKPLLIYLKASHGTEHDTRWASRKGPLWIESTTTGLNAVQQICYSSTASARASSEKAQ
jgi:hypothetical protein